jgi:hypothetical protein
MKNIKCFIHGHNHSKDDFGYKDTCNRCGKHEYYDSYAADPGCRYIDSVFQSYEFTIPHWWSIVVTWFRWKRERLFHTCQDCKKRERYFGIEVGDHKHCLPF